MAKRSRSTIVKNDESEHIISTQEMLARESRRASDALLKEALEIFDTIRQNEDALDQKALDMFNIEREIALNKAEMALNKVNLASYEVDLAKYKNKIQILESISHHTGFFSFITNVANYLYEFKFKENFIYSKHIIGKSVREILASEGIPENIISNVELKISNIFDNNNNSNDYIINNNDIGNIPTEAPLKWRDRRSRHETSNIGPKDFIIEVYKDYLGKGMTTGTLARIDPTLYQRHNLLPDEAKVPVSLLPSQANAVLSESELRARAEKARVANREKQARFRERQKTEGRDK